MDVSHQDLEVILNAMRLAERALERDRREGTSQYIGIRTLRERLDKALKDGAAITFAAHSR
jgi:hypothetical protein